MLPVPNCRWLGQGLADRCQPSTPMVFDHFTSDLVCNLVTTVKVSRLFQLVWTLRSVAAQAACTDSQGEHNSPESQDRRWRLQSRWEMRSRHTGRVAEISRLTALELQQFISQHAAGSCLFRREYNIRASFTVTAHQLCDAGERTFTANFSARCVYV